MTHCSRRPRCSSSRLPTTNSKRCPNSPGTRSRRCRTPRCWRWPCRRHRCHGRIWPAASRACARTVPRRRWCSGSASGSMEGRTTGRATRRWSARAACCSRASRTRPRLRRVLTDATALPAEVEGWLALRVPGLPAAVEHLIHAIVERVAALRGGRRAAGLDRPRGADRAHLVPCRRRAGPGKWLAAAHARARGAPAPGRDRRRYWHWRWSAATATTRRSAARAFGSSASGPARSAARSAGSGCSTAGSGARQSSRRGSRRGPGIAAGRRRGATPSPLAAGDFDGGDSRRESEPPDARSAGVAPLGSTSLDRGRAARGGDRSPRFPRVTWRWAARAQSAATQ